MANEQLLPANIRSVAVVGHKGAGKTALIEALGYLTRAVSRLGKVGERGLGLDDTPEEHAHESTFETRLVTLQWGDTQLYLLDTPGEASFIAETQLAFAAADAVLLVVSARAGVESGTQRLARMVLEARKPCLVALTRCDDEQARVEEVLAQIRKLKEPIALVEVPHHHGGDAALDGVVAVTSMKAWVGHRESPDQIAPDPIPDDVQEAVRQTREKLVDDVAGTDDALTDHYLTDGDLTAQELRDGERHAVAQGKLVPVLFTSASVPFGIVALLEALVDFAPAPGDLPAWPCAAEGETNGKGAPTRARSTEAPLSALVVKNKVDAHGRLSIVRVVSGVLKPDGHAVCARSGERERISQVLSGHGRELKQIPRAVAGAFAIVPKLKSAQAGDTLCDDRALAQLIVPEPPVALFSRAVHSAQKTADEKVAQVLHTLAEEDPSLKVSLDAASHQLIVSGLGAVHLDVTIERLKRRTRLDVKLGPPRIEYRETIARPVRGVEGKQKKQTGGHGQFGVVYLDVEPRARGTGFEFEDAVVGGTVPRQYVGSVKKGIERALARGVLAGYPIVDVKVRLTDGKHHSVDSSDAAFQTAGYRGFLAAARAAHPQLLEPIARLSLSVPTQSLGDVLGDLASRNAGVLGQEVGDELTHIEAHLPFAQLMDYEPFLSARTQGRGRFTFAFAHYDTVLPAAQAKVVRESGFGSESDDD